MLSILLKFYHFILRNGDEKTDPYFGYCEFEMRNTLHYIPVLSKYVILHAQMGYVEHKEYSGNVKRTFFQLQNCHHFFWTGCGAVNILCVWI